jgi:RimJ/RimL family protein N-acetyltransferase
VRTALSRVSRPLALATDFALGIWQLDESRLLGGCGYHLREGPLHLGNAEIGMWIRAEAAGRGLGTAALRSALALGILRVAVGAAVLALQRRE